MVAFGGYSTIDTVVAPALSRFVENTFVYQMSIWDAFLGSFGEDTHVLQSTPVVLIWAVRERGSDGKMERIVRSRMLALADLQNGRPWGLDLYRCHSCQGSAQDISFKADGKQAPGRNWLQNAIQYSCFRCKHAARKLHCPAWVKPVVGLQYRVCYPWPLSTTQLAEIGVTDVSLIV